MKRRFVLLAGGIAGALAIAAPLTALPERASNFNKSSNHYDDECGETADNQLFITAPTSLWPPNHKYYDAISATADAADGETVESLTTVGTHDQYDADTGAEQNGSGHTADDMTVDDEEAEVTPDSDPEAGGPQPLASEGGDNTETTDWDARAERSGRDQTGRTYTLSATAVFSDGTECDMEWSFDVPHDLGVGEPQNTKKDDA